MLDDSRSYSRTTRPDGTSSIVNDTGDEVAVADGSKVAFADAEGRQVVADTARGTTTTTAEDGSYGIEEVNIDEDQEAIEEAGEASDSAAPDDATTTAQGPGVVALLLGAVVAAVGVVLWKRAKSR